MKLTQPTKAVFNWSLIIAIVAAVCFIVSFIIAPALLGLYCFWPDDCCFCSTDTRRCFKGFLTPFFKFYQ